MTALPSLDARPAAPCARRRKTSLRVRPPNANPPMRRKSRRVDVSVSMFASLTVQVTPLDRTTCETAPWLRISCHSYMLPGRLQRQSPQPRLSSIGRWKQPLCLQLFANLHCVRLVHGQDWDGAAAEGRAAFKKWATPAEVPAPLVSPRMEQLGQPLGHRIDT